jgi:hypothetical protein
MKFVVALFVLKLITLAGSTATTLGFVSLFAFKDSLGLYTWPLFGAGFAAVLVGELGAYLLARFMVKPEQP